MAVDDAQTTREEAASAPELAAAAARRGAALGTRRARRKVGEAASKKVAALASGHPALAVAVRAIGVAGRASGATGRFIGGRERSEPSRNGSGAGRKKWPLAVAVSLALLSALLALPLLAILSFNRAAGSSLAALQLTVLSNQGSAMADIPAVVLDAYVRAAAEASRLQPGCSLRPAILAGIGSVESGHGTFGGASADAAGWVIPPIIGPPLNGSGGTAAISDTDGGKWDGDEVWDRAVGPMQFIPTSWLIYGQDGNGDGVADPHNVFDAALAAVAHLCAASPTDMNVSEQALRDAIFAYNHSSSYVSAVVERIQFYDLALAGGGSADVGALLANPNFSVYAGGRADLEAGIVDPRVVSLLSLLAQRTTISVSSLKTGHSQFVAGTTSVSNHWSGRAVDISVVGGAAVNDNNSEARQIVQMLAAIPVGDPGRPDEVGSPWPEFNPIVGWFNNADHEDHLHIGWDG